MFERGDIVKTKDGRLGYVVGIRRTTCENGYYIRFDDELFAERDLTIEEKVNNYARKLYAKLFLEMAERMIDDMEN